MRERLFKLLFRVEFNPKDEMAEQENFFFDSEENTGSEEENAWISGKLVGKHPQIFSLKKN